MPKPPPSRWKGKRCPSCGGQMNPSPALYLRDENGEPITYVTCPADCNGNGRRDLDARPKGGAR